MENVSRGSLLLLFPPNWSACVSGPHLALPLIAGASRNAGIEVQSWDLSWEFYRRYGTPPSSTELISACLEKDFNSLDKYYFRWEDSICNQADMNNIQFGLLSGFSEKNFQSISLKALVQGLRNDSIYCQFYDTYLRERVIELNPKMIGVTISSQNQIASTIALLIKLRTWLPNVKLVLGGNVVTRLYNLAPEDYDLLKSLVDHIINYQGEIAISDIFTSTKMDKIQGHEKIDTSLWPIPIFDGLPIGRYPGYNSIPFVSTRGCYWGKCSFCAIPEGWSKSGYAGSLPHNSIMQHVNNMVESTGVSNIKFVDEAFPPSKVFGLYDLIKYNHPFLWEAYARLESSWEEEERIVAAYLSGCRKLYFGLEMAPSENRKYLGKNDKGNILKIMRLCKEVGINVHLFCMVGHPKTTKQDADRTVRFLIEHAELIDTADLVGFRLDKGTMVGGVMPIRDDTPSYYLSNKFQPTENGIMNYDEVIRLENSCQEKLWDAVPRLLHPLYRIGMPWNKNIPQTSILHAQSENVINV